MTITRLMILDISSLRRIKSKITNDGQSYAPPHD
jgi:hypothetical protein